jgi:serine/threonine-protein kinase HipA
MNINELGPIVRFHRKKAKLNQQELARLAGVGKTFIFDVEKGKTSIQLDFLLKVLHVLNIKIDFQSPLMSLFQEQSKEKGKVFVNDLFAGYLIEVVRGKEYLFTYVDGYKGESVSLTMPISQKEYRYDRFPPFFEGVLPEGIMLEGLLRRTKIDRNDLMSQLIAVGGDLVGNVTVEAFDE